MRYGRMAHSSVESERNASRLSPELFGQAPPHRLARQFNGTELLDLDRTAGRSPEHGPSLAAGQQAQRGYDKPILHLTRIQRSAELRLDLPNRVAAREEVVLGPLPR